MDVFKNCKKCGEEKSINEFDLCKTGKDGHYNICKKCRYESSQIWKKNNPDKVREYGRKWANNNRKPISDETEQERSDRLAMRKIYNKKYRETHKEQIRLSFQTEEFREKNNLYLKNKKETDILFKLKCRLRTMTCQAFSRKSFNKNGKTFNILGADVDFMKEYIESKFVGSMSWENSNEWQIDHIIPLSSAKDEEEMLLLCHHTNLQPLWTEDNQRKSDKYNEQEKQAFLETLRPEKQKNNIC